MEASIKAEWVALLDRLVDIGAMSEVISLDQQRRLRDIGTEICKDMTFEEFVNEYIPLTKIYCSDSRNEKNGRRD